LRDLSSVDPADSAAWRPVAVVAAARLAAAAEVQLRAVAVEERGALPEAVEAANAPRLEAAVEAQGAPRAAEVEALGARLEAVEVKAPGALPRPEVGVEVRGAPLEAADAPRLEAAVEARGARLEAVEVKAPGALPRPEVGVEVRGARPMAALVVGPAAVSAGQSPARRLALAEAVARAVPAAVALVVLTTVPAASQRLQHLASVVRMALSSAPTQPVGLAVVPTGSAVNREQLSGTDSES
jgi:hypothetical protein